MEKYLIQETLKRAVSQDISNLTIGSGIYEINCKCGIKYVGKTIRKFTQRLNEHKHRLIHNFPEKSKYTTHLLESYHAFNPDNFHILKLIPNTKLINTWEHLEKFLKLIIIQKY